MCMHHTTKMHKTTKVKLSRCASTRNVAPRYKICAGYIHIHTYVSTLHVTIKCQNVYIYTTKWQIFMIVIAVIFQSHWTFGNIRLKHFETTTKERNLSPWAYLFVCYFPHKFTNLCKDGSDLVASQYHISSILTIWVVLVFVSMTVCFIFW